jgi:replication-associated recombination protein RarA
MKIKDLKIFKKHFEKKEQLKLQKKQEFVALIKKEWDKKELAQMQIQNMINVYYSNDIGYKYGHSYFTPNPIQNFDEFELKNYMVYSNAKMFTEDEIIDLLNDIKKQKIKKKNI